MYLLCMVTLSKMMTPPSFSRLFNHLSMKMTTDHLNKVINEGNLWFYSGPQQHSQTKP